MPQQASTVPMKPNVAVRDLVRDIAEGVAPHGWRVIKHSEAHDYEKSEKKVTVILVKAEDGQGILDYSSGSGPANGAGGEPDDAEDD